MFSPTRTYVTLLSAAFLIACVARSDPTTTPQAQPTYSWALDRLDQRSLPLSKKPFKTKATGKGVTIYFFDGGIAHHPDLEGRISDTAYAAFPEENGYACNSHGTAVAGAAAGTSWGVAKQARVVDVKIIQCSSGRGTLEGVALAAEWVIQRHEKTGGPSVVNWSFSVDTGKTVPLMLQVVGMLHNAGITVVIAAGNWDMDACRISPANAPGAIVVGSSTLKDEKAPLSAWGDCITVYAPGDSVPLPTVLYGVDTVIPWWGTSMSAGYVSGAAALYLETHPKARADDVYAYIHSQASPIIKTAYGNFGRLLFLNPRY